MSAYRCVVGWMVDTLLGDEAVTAVVGERVYEGLGPRNATYPFVTIEPYTDPSTTNFQGGAHALTTVDVQVRVWDAAPDSKGSSAAHIAPVADRIDELFHGAGPVIRPEAAVLDSQAYSECPSTEFADEQVIRAMGSRFYVVVGSRA